MSEQRKLTDEDLFKLRAAAAKIAANSKDIAVVVLNRFEADYREKLAEPDEALASFALVHAYQALADEAGRRYGEHWEKAKAVMLAAPT